MKNYRKNYKTSKRQKVTNSESQRIFFECVHFPHLSEFLYRVTDGKFDSDIINAIYNDPNYNPPNDLQIHSEIGSTASNNPSIYTKIYYNNIDQAHLSIHLCPNNYKKEANGPFHVVNMVETHHENNKVSQRIYIEKKSNGALHFLLGSPQHSKMVLRPEIKKITNYILHVLNKYFDVVGPMRVGIAQYPLTNHPLLTRIKQIRQSIASSKSQDQKTRKQSRR